MPRSKRRAPGKPRPASPRAPRLTPGIDRLDDALASGDLEALRRALRELEPSDRDLLEIELGADPLRRALRQARRGPRSLAPRGRVIVLNGIMGAELGVESAGGKRDLVWVSLLRLAAGGIGTLALDAEGRSRPGVRVAGIRREYVSLLAELGESWEVRPYPFDWRLDIDASADGLAQLVRVFGRGEPVHLVAHSMGGLVARRMIQRHRDLWDSMDDPDGHRRGGRLVMLGTPNRGSLAIAPVLTGRERLVWWLEKLDQRHDMRELLGVLATFVGSYQMLPSPRIQLPDDRERLFQRASWGSVAVDARWLERGRRFQEEMFEVTTPERLVYVAGFDERTPHRIRVKSPGEFEYQETFAGDGRVPHELGLLPGVDTFWVREKHGDLIRNDAVLSGIHGLLETGATSELARAAGAQRRAPPDGAWHPASHFAEARDDERESARLLAALGTRRGAEGAQPDTAAMLQIERGLLRGWVGGGESAERERGATHDAAARSSRRPRRRLDVRVVWGDVRRVEADVVAVGHYPGVLPQYAEKALDETVSPPGAPYDDRVLVRLTRRGVIRGDLGEVHLVPRVDSAPRAEGRGPARPRFVAVAGMGPSGGFGVTALRRLVRQLVGTVASLPQVQSLAMVLIGSGAGNLDTTTAVEGLVRGLRDALEEIPGDATLESVTIVDTDRAKAEQIQAALGRALRRPRGEAKPALALAPSLVVHRDARVGRRSGLALALSHAARAATAERARLVRLVPDAHGARDAVEQGLEELRQKGGTAQEIADRIQIVDRREEDGGKQRPPTRLAFTQDGPDLRVAAITDTAVTPERILSFDRGLLDQLVEQMTDPEPEDVRRLSKLLARLVVPHDFRSLLRESGSIVFELDRETARVHWEMLETHPDDDAPERLALQIPIARQLRTTYSPAPSPESVRADKLRVLVIGDPGDPRVKDDLVGARREAIAIWQMLAKREDVDVTAMIGAPSSPPGSRPRGARPAGLLEVLGELLEGGYDVVHYTGHGDFDEKDGTRVGWLFEGGQLTARELELVTSPPRLVVANACLSGLTSRVRGRAGERPSRREAELLPSLADEFFRRGVRDYVGTAWEVNDEGAVTFASELYARLLGSAEAPAVSIGEALLHARAAVAQHEELYGALWAAYQHYGDPQTVLVRPPSAASDGAKPSRKASRSLRAGKRGAKA